ncbi:MAG: HlyD family efflux transporter periplasmic adaptor subunit [Methyloligellaceae bacterium]
MNAPWIKRLTGGALLLAAAGLFVYALLPQPVLVDVETVSRGELRVTVDEEGETRIREIYAVSSPIDGKVLRSPREVGDAVKKDETIVAIIEPAEPSFLDVRRRRELEAAVAAARAAVRLAESEVRRAKSELKFAEKDLARTRALAERGTISQRTLEKAELEVEVRRAALAEAIATLELREKELESAKARLIGPQDRDVIASEESCCIEVRAPIDGVVLRIDRESEQVVKAGDPLLQIGDPRDLEIVVDLLSTDAVKVKPGADAVVEGWGGREPLRARVRRIEPAAFTKISALGIEEQRVNTILDFTDPKESLPPLGHGFRVFVRITVWSGENVLRVPLGALFREGSAWAVFSVVDGKAQLVRVQIGHRNSTHAEVLAGLAENTPVIVHPSDRVADGVAVEVRHPTRLH